MEVPQEILELTVNWTIFGSCKDDDQADQPDDNENKIASKYKIVLIMSDLTK